jgi:hypothetical protein
MTSDEISKQAKDALEKGTLSKAPTMLQFEQLEDKVKVI